MAAAPWDDVAAEDQLFVLITGANRYLLAPLASGFHNAVASTLVKLMPPSGIGLGIGQRLIDEFLTQRPSSSHLTIITTTRSSRKSAETTNALREHLRLAAHSPRASSSESPPVHGPKDVIRRVHLFSIQLDLCELQSVYAAADQLVNGTVSSPCDDGDFENLVDVRIPRLDAVILNAGVGGWTGLDWPKLVINFISVGLTQAVTFPTFKAAESGYVVDPLSGKSTQLRASPAEADHLLGQVFCANVFGHYLLARRLLPLLSRPRGGRIPPGRIIWESSIEAGDWNKLSLDDFQAIRSRAAYESTKRLTDILSLTADLPGVRPFSSPYFALGDDAATEKPTMYLTHPGVVCSTLFPLSAFLFFWYRLVMYLARWLGSPWHPVTAYGGACAPVWAALQPQGDLDARGGAAVKWGSSAARLGRATVKKSEVEGWGWEGRVEDAAAPPADGAEGLLRNAIGRKAGAVDLTPERRDEFEALGAECWREMERLRLKWEEVLEHRGNLVHGKA